MGGNLQNLKARHHKIISLELDGRTHRQIADQLGMSIEWIMTISKSPLYQHELCRVRETHHAQAAEDNSVRRISASDILSEAAIGAAETQVGLLKSSNEKIQQTSAMDILDRSGHPKISKSENRNINASFVLTEGLLDRLQLASKDAFGKDFDTSCLEGAKAAPSVPGQV